MIELLAGFRDAIARLLSRVDVPLMAALTGLMVVSLLVQSSASDNTLHAVLAQGARFVLGSAALLLLANTTPATLRSWTPSTGAPRSSLSCARLFGTQTSAAPKLSSANAWD